MTQTLYIIAFLAISFASAFSVFDVAACDLTPMMPPPHPRSIALAFSLYCWRMAVTSWLNSCRSWRAEDEGGGVSGQDAPVVAGAWGESGAAGRRMLSALEVAPIGGAQATGRWRRGGGAHLAADRGQRKRGRGLLVHKGSQARLALDDAIGDVHLAADRR